MTHSKSLPRLLWLWLPLVCLILVLVLDFILPYARAAKLYVENGPIEMLQVFVLALALIAAFRGMAKVRPDRFLLVWLGIAALGCVYVLGEEISWGQHFLGWETPEDWRAINDQQETNIHNTSSWFDQKPRLLLEVGTVAGGLILPFIAGRIKLPGWLETICPPKTLVVTAAAFVFVKLSDKIGDMTGFYTFQRPSELAELAVYYFVFLYLYGFVRQKRTSRPEGLEAPEQ